ncbi:MAG: hypothetical protein RUDDFDWM_000016 [Candidatus Fervidibacterota bacterium]
MASPDVLVVVNPLAGRGRAIRLAEDLKVELSKLSLSTIIVWTAGRGHAEEITRQWIKRGVGCIAVCGGDGTVNEVVNVLVGKEVPVAVLPGGRCCDFARALRMPRSPKLIANAIARMKTLRVDLGMVGKRVFATVATLGFDAEVTRIVFEGRSKFHGMPAYVFAALCLMSVYRFPYVHIKADFGEFEGRILLAATANTPAYGGGLLIAPRASITDGLLNMCLIREAPKLSIFLYLPTVFFGLHTMHSAVSIHTLREASIDSPQPLWLYADGEPMSLTPTEIKVVPSSLNVVVAET